MSGFDGLPGETDRLLSRRSVLRAGGGLLGLTALSGVVGGLWRPVSARADDPPAYDYETFGYGPYGSYNPQGTGVPGGLNCGIPAGSPPLTVDRKASTLVITAGGHYDLIQFNRRVQINTGEPVIFTRCLFTGPPSVSNKVVPCVDARGPSVNVELYDCEITANLTSPWIPGISGHDMTVQRCYVHEVLDGFQLFNLYNANGPANVEISGCLVSSLTYVTPAPRNSDNRTHNDGIEIFGNSNISIVGNCLLANVSATKGNPDGAPVPDPYVPSSIAQCIAITNGTAPVSDVTIDRNFLDYGRQSITLIPHGSATCSDITITNNVFGRNQPSVRKTYDLVYRQRPILIDPSCQVNNFPTVTGTDDLCGNVYGDDASPVTIYRFPDGQA